MMLMQLLSMLEHQEFRAEYPELEILVIDNDPSQSAKETVALFKDRLPWPLHYAAVAEPGLSVVRNFALSFARRQFDLLAMIDDDEEPVAYWLDELLRVQVLTTADAVVGPVERELPAGAPQWIVEGGFFGYIRGVDGQMLNDGHTGNCLLHVATISTFDLAFDPALNISGGEDQLFFRQMFSRGGRIAFAAQALATERVPPERTNARYLLMLQFRKGNTLAYCDRTISPTIGRLLTRLGKGVALVVIGTTVFVPWIATKRTHGAMKAACAVARGAGMLAGLIGVRTASYARRITGALPAR